MKCPNCDNPEMAEHEDPEGSGETLYYCHECGHQETR